MAKALDLSKAMDALAKWAGKYEFRTLPGETISLDHNDATVQIKIEPGGGADEVRIKWTSRGTPKSGDANVIITPEP